MSKRKTQPEAFTLIELLLYVSITSLILLSVSIALAMVVQSQVRSNVVRTVEDEGLYYNQFIAQRIREAESVTSPVKGATDNELELVLADSGISPSIFALSSGELTLEEGSGSAVSLSSGWVVLSDLNFENRGLSGGQDSIHYSFTVTYSSSSARAGYDYSRDFTSSVSLRD